ncbi:MAG: hypothetical protein LPK19_03110, partial [Hymenobacteraceae bacterium]|nr:hypothetical protein [Hymenobacteraceae bacterium]MDX5511216.1 hypothetical protein [Hymenobacteraceae bacterium]
QAEITFTPKHVITKNSRIRVDFEYSDRNYNRSVFHLSHYQTLNRAKIYGNFYNEGDNPNNPFTLQLNQQQRELLASIGDSLNKAVTSGADTVEFSRNQVLYIRKDSIVDGIAYSIYQYSTDSTQTVYSVSFTEVGQGRGDYVQENTTVNGRVFRWVAPVNGVPQGRYAPVRVLPAPLKKQMLTLGGSYQVDAYSQVFLEGAASQLDINRFSDIDSEDDNGQAFRVGYTVENRPLEFLQTYRLNSSMSYEYNDANFNPIDRYRDIEFDRDWSLPNTNTKVSDNIFNFSVGAVQNAQNAVNYRISRRYRAGEVEGMQHWLSANKQLGRVELISNFFLLNSTRETSESDWVRGEIGARYPLKWVVPGYTYRFDKNKVTQLNTDSVIGSAMYFDEHVFFVESNDSSRTKFRLDYSYREDLRPFEGELANREVAQTYNASVNTRLGQNHLITGLFTFRDLNSTDSADVTNVMTQLDWSADLLDEHLRSELSYSIATGREVKREFVFVETPAGEGTHYWEDLNRDNVQDLNEFFEAQTVDQRRYIKLFLPTDEYVKAFTNRFTYRLNASMPRNWRAKRGVLQFLSRFSSLTFLSVDKKTTDNDLLSRFNPFSQDFEDQFLISLGQSVRQTVYYNRSNPKYGLELSALQNQQKF